MANKWRKRARKWKERNVSLWDFWHHTSDQLVAALNKTEELRRDLVKSGTELARVQGVCDADEAERRNLLAWRKRVRKSWAAYDAEDEVDAATLSDLRQAIESDEPKEESFVGQVTNRTRILRG